jgi:hypothetical protein
MGLVINLLGKKIVAVPFKTCFTNIMQILTQHLLYRTVKQKVEAILKDGLLM